MHKLHVAITATGIALSVLIAIFYYWSRGMVFRRETSSALGIGMLLGLAAIGAQKTDYFIFAIIISGYVAYFIHLKNHAEFNASTESTMVSLFMGSVMGFSSLIGCVACSG